MNMKEHTNAVIMNIRELGSYMRNVAQLKYACNSASFDELERVKNSVELLDEACKLMEEYSRVLDEQSRKLDMILEKLEDKA